MNAVASARDTARARFERAGVPNRRVEAWKYSDLHRLVDAETVSLAGTAQWSLAALPHGVEAFDLSQPDPPKWVEFGGHGVMAEAAAAFARGGVALRVAAPVEAPLALTFTSAGHARVYIVLEPNASLTLLEKHEMGIGLRNIALDVVLDEGASFIHARLAEAAPDQVRVETVSASLGKNARYAGHFADLGGKLSRLELALLLEGVGASVELSGVAFVGGESHADVTGHVDHAVGNTQSRQLFRYVAGATARGVYQGKITVREGADKSDSRQTAKGLLLHDRAEIDLKPELEILADDVKCAHGAAIGDLEPEQLFYLRARGISEAEARALLIRAFLEDTFASVESEEIRAMLWREIETALRGIA